MSDLREYKCPACGGAMEFDSGSQKMKCPFCDTEVSIEEFEQEQKKNPEETRWEAGNGAQWKEDEISGMAVYSCQSCGGECHAHKTTGATTCPFCGHRVVLNGQFERELRPDYIIPFKLDKKAAKAAYYKHLEKKSFLPKVFSFENHIDEIVGVYVPFWLFDVDAQAYMTYNAERIRTWRQGNKEHTEHEYYHVDRAGGIEFEHVPTDCSRKMDDALMEAIEPYDFKDAVPFQTPYLAGCVADRYDVNMEECMGRATNRIRQSAEDALRETVKGYQTVTNLSELSYNVVITLTKGTETFSYSPSLSLMDGALYAYNLDGMEIYDFTLYDNLEIPVWNEGGECGGCGDPEGYGAPLEAAGEEPGLIGQWISTELKNQSGQNITYGMYFGDYQYFEFQYGQMGHDLECWSGTFEVTDQFRNGELVVHYVLYTPDGTREGEFYTMVNYGEMLVTEGSGDAIFPFTDASTEWFYSY